MASNVLEKALKNLAKWEQATRGDLELNFPQMKSLVEGKYVKEVGYAEPEGRGRPPMVYELTAKGIKAVKEGLDLNGDRPKRGRPPGSGKKTTKGKGKATASRATGKRTVKAGKASTGRKSGGAAKKRGPVKLTLRK